MRLHDSKFYSNHTAMILGYSRWLLDGFFVAQIFRIFSSLDMTRFPLNLLSTSKTFESELQEIAWHYNKGASLALGQCTYLTFFEHVYMDLEI